MEVLYPRLTFDRQRDSLVCWIRWISREDPPSPMDPPAQGIRVECQINRNPVLGPTIVYRRDLAAPIYLRAHRLRTVAALEAAGAVVDLQLIIHGSIANAPFIALYHLRDYPGEAIDTAAVPATPLLQLQPSTPGDRWHVAAQANLRVALELVGAAPHRLPVLR